MSLQREFHHAKKKSILNTKSIARLKIAVGIAVPLCLLLLPYNFFDEGPPLCFSRILFGLECMGCGTSRAMMRILHGRFVEAWAFNPLGFAALPLLAFFWVKWFFKNIKEMR
jgi:hypothetical protein